MKELHAWYGAPGGTFKGGKIARAGVPGGGSPDCSRLYVPSVCIPAPSAPGAAPVAMIEARAGCKEGGKQYGQLVAALNDAGASSWAFYNPTTGTGRIAADPALPGLAIVMSKNGAWYKVKAALNAPGILSKGWLDFGGTGEKIGFVIAPRPGKDSIWHCCMNGCRVDPSKYNNSLRHAQRLPRVLWASYATYPMQGSDFAYCGIGLIPGHPSKAIMGAYFGNHFRVNIWNGAKMRYSPYALPEIFPAADEIRHAPSFSVAAGRPVAAFRDTGGNIRLADCFACLDGQAAAPVMAAGRYPSIVETPEGLALARVENGALTVSGFGVS
jgi:hypothetical protein